MMYLRDNGHTGLLVTSAQQAILALDKISPDLIILELQLAGHNGVEFLYELRSYTDLQTVPVLVHTVIPKGSFADADTMLAALGVTDYLYKPMTSLRKFGEAVEKHTGVPV